MKRCALFFFFCLLGLVVISQAQIPNKISYQGLLTNPSGTPVQDGSYNLKFDIYNLPTGGTLRYTETQAGVALQRGAFSVALGAVTTLSPIFSESLYVEVTAVAGPSIGSPVTFSPRSELTSAPYALAPWVPSGNNISFSKGNVGIGTTSPARNLHISRDDFASAQGIVIENTSTATDFTGTILELNNPNVSGDPTYGQFFIGRNAFGVSTPGGRIGTTSNHPFSLRTNNIERLFITSSGNVGIGTMTPGAKLDIAGLTQVKYDGQPASLSIVTPNASAGDNGGTRLLFTPQNLATQQEIWGVDGRLSLRTGGVPGSVDPVERVSITSNGNVGIGTLNPNALLDIQSSGAEKFYLGQYSTDANGSNARFQKARGTQSSPGAVSSGDNILSLVFQGYAGGFENAASIEAFVDGMPGSGDMPGRLTFSTTPDGSSATVERMRIDNTGNIGIGTTSPGYLLDVQKNNPTQVNVQTTSSSHYANYRVDADQGINAYADLIHFSSGYSGNIMGLPAANKAALYSDGSSSGGLVVQTYTSDPLFFGTNNIERMRIDASGNVGIGTTSPSNKLTVADGNIRIVNTAAGYGANTYSVADGTNGLLVGQTASDAGGTVPNSSGFIWDALNNSPIVFATTSGSGDGEWNERMRIAASGNVGVGTTTPSEKLEVAGNIKIGNATIRSGTGSPEGAVTGNVGDLYLRTDGGAGTTMYVKESGNGTNTGWVGK